MMKTEHTAAILAIALLSGLASAGVGSLILDDFDADPNDDAAGARTMSSGIGADPLGQGGEFTLDVGFDSGSDIGAVFFNSGISAEQTGSLDYREIDLDLSAYNALEMDFLASDQAFELRFVIIGSGGGKAVQEFMIDAGGAQTANFAFADFDTFGFDWSDLESLRISLNSGDTVPSLDFAISELRAVVPAPSSIAMLAMGGFAATRRRR